MAEKNNTLSVKENFDLSIPSQMVAMSVVLKRHVVEQKLYTSIQGKNYVQVEGWQFAGGLMGLYPRVTEVENLTTTKEVKWKAEAEIVRLKDDKVVSRGFAICSNLEAKKKGNDEYAILSMAQTRAIGKGYRNLVGWVMKLAGYESTPSEEMFKVGQNTPAPVAPVKDMTEAPADGLTGFECFDGAEPITKEVFEYSKKIYGKPFCRTHQKDHKPKTQK